MYEQIMTFYKKKYSKQEYETKEVMINIGASIISGAVSSAITNPMECITVNLQTQ
jgi:fructose-specific phosphotransferase system IIC component